jgi:hypothetical protein
MSELSCTFEEFKRRAKFAIDQHRAGTLKPEEHDQLVKMVSLSYMNLSDFDAPTVNIQAPIALKLFQQEMGLLPKYPHEAFATIRTFIRDMEAIAA